MLEVFFFFSSVCVREKKKSFPSAFLEGQGEMKKKKVYKIDKKGRYIYIYID